MDRAEVVQRIEEINKQIIQLVEAKNEMQTKCDEAAQEYEKLGGLIRQNNEDTTALYRQMRGVANNLNRTEVTKTFLNSMLDRSDFYTWNYFMTGDSLLRIYWQPSVPYGSGFEEALHHEDRILLYGLTLVDIGQYDEGGVHYRLNDGIEIHFDNIFAVKQFLQNNNITFNVTKSNIQKDLDAYEQYIEALDLMQELCSFQSEIVQGDTPERVQGHIPQGHIPRPVLRVIGGAAAAVTINNGNF